MEEEAFLQEVEMKTWLVDASHFSKLCPRDLEIKDVAVEVWVTCLDMNVESEDCKRCIEQVKQRLEKLGFKTKFLMGKG